MNKFIEALEEKGIVERIIESQILGGNGYTEKATKDIIKFEIARDEELSSLFVEEYATKAISEVSEYVKQKYQEVDAEVVMKTVEEKTKDVDMGALLSALMMMMIK